MIRRSIFIAIAMLITVPLLEAQNGKDLRDAFSLSYKAETAGEYSKAIETLKRVYREDSYEINLRLGWLTYNIGSFAESAAFYNKAIQLMPFSIEARLGFVLPASAMGNWDQVILRYNEILKIDPNHYLTNYRLGLIFYYREDYQTAFRYFERIANMYPFDYDAVIMFSWTQLGLQNNREAKALFNRALLIRPDDASALQGLGMIR